MKFFLYVILIVAQISCKEKSGEIIPMQEILSQIWNIYYCIFGTVRRKKVFLY